MRDPLPALATELSEGAAGSQRRVIIGILGAPGTGKSTVAQRLQGLVGEDICVVVPMDGFHLSQDVIRGTDLETRKGAADTFDVGGYINLLERLKRNREDVIYAPDYRRSVEDPIAAAIAIPKSVRVVLTEGNYLLADTGRWGEVRQFLDETWFVDTPHDVRVARLIQRHTAFGKAPDVAAQWAKGSDEQNALLVEATRSRADRIIVWQ
ncbi:nucleoside/nucleotide kinase family protein [Rhodoglobus aureus]|uniref:Nucleoside/nucleotide kinase family protein n=1 Tax=Rhodoglobus aureus TaxID=191497 RepID=A0ABN1VHE7_9MICO